MTKFYKHLAICCPTINTFHSRYAFNPFISKQWRTEELNTNYSLQEIPLTDPVAPAGGHRTRTAARRVAPGGPSRSRFAGSGAADKRPPERHRPRPIQRPQRVLPRQRGRHPPADRPRRPPVDWCSRPRSGVARSRAAAPSSWSSTPRPTGAPGPSCWSGATISGSAHTSTVLGWEEKRKSKRGNRREKSLLNTRQKEDSLAQLVCVFCYYGYPKSGGYREKGKEMEKSLWRKNKEKQVHRAKTKACS